MRSWNGKAFAEEVDARAVEELARRCLERAHRLRRSHDPDHRDDADSFEMLHSVLTEYLLGDA